MAEQTEEDRRKFYHQQKKVREFMNYTNQNMVSRLGIHNSKDYEEEQQKEIEELTAKPPGMGAAASDVPDGDFGVQKADRGGAQSGTEIGWQSDCENAQGFGSSWGDCPPYTDEGVQEDSPEIPGGDPVVLQGTSPIAEEDEDALAIAMAFDQA